LRCQAGSCTVRLLLLVLLSSAGSVAHEGSSSIAADGCQGRKHAAEAHCQVGCLHSGMVLRQLLLLLLLLLRLLLLLSELLLLSHGGQPGQQLPLTHSSEGSRCIIQTSTRLARPTVATAVAGSCAVQQAELLLLLLLRRRRSRHTLLDCKL
jgi:hypothetical protein